MVKRTTKKVAATETNEAGDVLVPIKKKAAPKKKATTKKKAATKKKGTTAKKATATKAKAKKPAAVKKAAGDLSAPQVRVLAALKKNKKPMERGPLAEAAEINPTMLSKVAGYVKPEINERAVHANNLLNLKLVKIEKQDVDGKDVITYSLTAAGLKKA